MSIGRNPLAASPAREIMRKPIDQPVLPMLLRLSGIFASPHLGHAPTCKVARLALGCLLVAASAIGWHGQAAAEDLALHEAASMSGVAMFLNARAPGLILAVVRGEDSFIAGYGETAPGSGAEPDGRSIVRVGSVSKVFATDVLAAMAAKGELSLDTPLARHAPPGKAPQAFDEDGNDVACANGADDAAHGRTPRAAVGPRS